MSITINGEWITSNNNKSQIQFNLFNPTKMNIKREIINYKTKLQSKQLKSSMPKTLLPDYEPKVLILPRTNVNEGSKFKSTEFIMSKKIKTEDKSKYDKKSNTIYKARATLKTRIYSNNDIFDDRKSMFHSRINSSYPTSSYFYPKFASCYGGSQSNSLCTMLNRKKNDYIEKMQKLTQNVAKIEQSSPPKTNPYGSPNSNGNTLTYILEKRLDQDLPITLPVALTHNLKYKSQSQRYRNQKIIETLSKVKFFLMNHPDLKKEIVREFLVKNKISGKEFYTDEKLDNFASYLRKGFTIQPNKTMKDIIIEGTQMNADQLARFQERKEEKKENESRPIAKEMRTTSSKMNSINASARRPTINISASHLVFDMNEQKKKLVDVNHEDKAEMLPEDHIKILKDDIENLNKKAESQTRFIDRCAERLYYDHKFKHDEANLMDVARKKSKLLEYIVYENALARQQFNEDTKIIDQQQQD